MPDDRKQCWLMEGCPSRTGVCYSCVPDGDACPIWRWFKKQILLKEQEPVEPSVDVDTYVCPNCGHRLEHQGMLGDNVIFDERYNFCPACGKAVKWNAAD